MAASPLDIAISILEKDVSRLELSIDGLEKYLWISSVAVAMGVTLEVWFIVHAYLDDRDSWRRGIIVSPSRPKFRVLLFEIASVLLVVAGIVGELWVGLVSANRNTELRSTNTKLIGLIREKAGAADERATVASDKATRANEHEEQLEVRTKHEIDARLALAKQLIWQGPRNVTIDADRSLFSDHLKRFSGQLVITSVCWGQFVSRGDQEIVLTANSVARALVDIGWKIDNFPSPPTMDETCGTIGEGVSVFVRSDAPKRTQEAARMLLAVIDAVLEQGTVIIPLNANGLKAMRLTNMQPDAIDVLFHMHTMRRAGPTIDDAKLLKNDKP